MQHVLVVDAGHVNPAQSERFVSSRVMAPLCVDFPMVRSIELDDEARRRAVEVHDVGADGMLSSDRHAEPRATHGTP